MGCQWYLAMTAAEALGYRGVEKMAWMSCHFSSYSTGLSNLPNSLPPDSLVILDDNTPLSDHDPERIAAQLAGLENMRGLLLDLQRPSRQAPALIDHLKNTLPCPVAVTEAYASDSDCAVFLSGPLNLPLSQAIKPWTGRALWLDIPFGVQTFTVTETGCTASDIQPPDGGAFPHRDDALHCGYRIRTARDHIQFTLHRSPDALPDILSEAQHLGITHALTLHQEFHRPYKSA